MKCFTLTLSAVLALALGLDTWAVPVDAHGNGAGGRGGFFSRFRERRAERRGGHGHGAAGHAAHGHAQMATVSMTTTTFQAAPMAVGCAGVQLGCAGRFIPAGDHPGFGRPFVVPPGYRLVPIEPVGKPTADPPKKDEKFDIRPGEETDGRRWAEVSALDAGDSIPDSAEFTVTPAAAFTIQAAAPPMPRAEVRPFVITPAGPAPTYRDAYNEAVRENKPLCVWVGGYRCHSTRDQLPGMVHHTAPDGWEGHKDPAVLVAVPGGDGIMYRASLVAAEDVCASNLRNAVERLLTAWGVPPATEAERRSWQVSTGGNGGAVANGGASAGTSVPTAAPVFSQPMVMQQPMMLRSSSVPMNTVRHVRAWAASRDGVCRG